MADQVFYKNDVGVPDPMIFLCEETKNLRDQTKKLLDDERANENARQAAEIGRANAEAIRVCQERQRVSAEAARQKRFERLATRIRALEDARARVAKVERRLDKLIDDYELVSLAIDTLGRLHNDVPYLYLNYGLHFGSGEAHIEDGHLVYDGALFAHGKLNYSGIINERNIPGVLPPGASYALVGKGMLFAEDKMHFENGVPIYDDATASGEALTFPGIFKIEE